MQAPRWHYFALALAAIALAAFLLAYPRPAHSTLYQFTIRESQGAMAIGTGDAARSQAQRFANGDVVVSVPLNTLNVPGLTSNVPNPGYLDIYTPPPGVVLQTALPQYFAEMGGGPPLTGCTTQTPAACMGPLGYAYVNWVSLPVDIWGHFTGGTGGTPLTWVANGDPGRRSFAALPTPGNIAHFPGQFSMTPLVPEPPIALLLGIGLTAVWLRAARGNRRPA